MLPLLPLLPLCILALSSVTNATLPTNTVLVVVDNDAVHNTHSRLIASLSNTGKAATIVPASSSSIPLAADGNYLYDALILLCPTASGLESRLPLPAVLRFIDSGGSLFLAASHNFSPYTEAVAASIGVDLEPRTHKLTDHQKFFAALDDGTHTYIRAGGHVPSSYLFGTSASTASSSLVFSGPGATLFTDNELVDSVMWGAGSCYATGARAPAKVPRSVGSSCVLAAALATRTGSRAAYFGSMAALSDAAFAAAGPSHGDAMTAFLAWALGQSGVLRATNVRHWRFGDEARVRHEEYRVKDRVVFAVDVQQWVSEEGMWRPFVAEDLQVEFVMLNPWVRKRLQYEGGVNGSYVAEIGVPDQIGVYKFKIEYVRPGVSPLMVEDVVAVRPFLHNEYERFIGMATPYYAACFSMLIGVFAMSIVVLFGGHIAADAHDKKE